MRALVTVSPKDLVRATVLLILVCTVYLGSSIHPPKAHASCPAGQHEVSVANTDQVDCVPDASTGGSSGQTQNGAADACSWTSFNLVDCIASGIAKMIASFLWTLVGLFAFLLSIVGAVFNFAALITIFQFSNYLGNSSGVLLAWGVLRDIANILLLFAFIYTGVLIILGNQNYGVGKTLPRLLIFAVLLNFSLFATEALIDIGNGLSSTLYTQASGFNCGGGAGDRAGFAACADQGIAGSLMTASGITSINQWQSGYSSILGTSDGTMALIGSAGVLALVVVLLGVLAAGAILLFVRAITLVLLMVTSPIGFAGPVIPGFSSMGKQWWDTLRNNIIFAPIFILLILVGFKIIEGLRNGLGLQNGVNLINIFTTGTPTTVGQGLAIFILTAGFFIAALIGSQKFAKVGTEMTSGIVKTANNMLGLAGRAGVMTTFGTAAMLGRQTVGRGANATANFLNRNPLLGQATPAWLQKAVTAPFKYGATASYDALGTGLIPGVGKTGQYFKATRGGYRGVVEQAAKDRVDFAQTVQGARNDYAAQRGQVSDAKQRQINTLQVQAAQATGAPQAGLLRRIKALEDDKARYDRKTEVAFMDGKSVKEMDRLRAEIIRLADSLKTATGNQKDALQNEKKLAEAQLKAITDNSNFQKRYAEGLMNLSMTLKKVGYDIKGMRKASMSLLRKKSNDQKLLDAFNEYQKAQAQNTPPNPPKP